MGDINGMEVRVAGFGLREHTWILSTGISSGEPKRKGSDVPRDRGRSAASGYEKEKHESGFTHWV